MIPPPLVICSRTWHDRTTEVSFAIRAIAGAASRGGPLSVFVPGVSGRTEPDGAFDLIPVGLGPDGGWPSRPTVDALRSVPAGSTVVLDRPEPEIAPLLASFASPRFLALTDASPAEQPLGIVALEADRGHQFIGLHVPINPLAATHRHNGFGFVDYILLLSGRTGTHDEPPDEVAWVTAAFPEDNVVLVEDGSASVWRGRALRGATDVDTRTDLWRLIAHARMCIDLAPGTVVAKECVESLRYGTPIVVPEAATAAAIHARSGGGLTFASMGELVHCVGRMDDATRQRLSDAGRSYADAIYGNPVAFTERVAQVLAA